MTTFSVLDFASITEEGSASQALAAAAELAAHAEKLGLYRFWMAEHHAMPGIASAAVSVCLAHIGNATRSIRIGSGGIMLPNHTPYLIAEQFGTLEALFPGRIDLGLGRAPGADGRITQALRKNLHAAADQFPDDVVELQAWLAGDARLPLQAIPGAGTNPEIWMLGSSLFGAQLAASLGLPYAFASHFAPAALDEALDIYRRRFQPSERLEKPHVMIAANAYVADRTEDAYYLASSMDQTFIALRTGNPGRLQKPVHGYRESLSPPVRATLQAFRAASAIGTPAEARDAMQALIARTQADEVILAGSTYDAEARQRSLTLAMQAFDGL